jgi:hypothetical protein
MTMLERQFLNARLLPLVGVSIMLVVALMSQSTSEEGDYGEVSLHGLQREHSWPYNPPGRSYSMVCNVSGPDGFLSIRSGSGTNYLIRRKLERLAIVEVDTRHRQGNWVRVVDAHREHTTDGWRQAYRHLPIQGWAHDGYLCGYLD